MIKTLTQHRFFRFLLVGGVCTLIDFVLFYILHIIIQCDLIPSNIASYGTGLACAFFINRYWTFADSQHRTRLQFWVSLLLGYFGLILNTAIIWILEDDMHVMLAKCIAVFIVVFYNYFGNKWLVFKVKQ